MEAVNVLFGRDAADKLLGVDMLRHGKLAEYAADGRIRIEAIDERDELLLLRIGGERKFERLYADLIAALLFIVDIHPRGGVVSDDYNRKARLNAAAFQIFHALAYRVEHICGNKLSVYQLCHLIHSFRLIYSVFSLSSCFSSSGISSIFSSGSFSGASSETSSDFSAEVSSVCACIAAASSARRSFLVFTASSGK